MTATSELTEAREVNRSSSSTTSSSSSPFRRSLSTYWTTSPGRGAGETLVLLCAVSRQLATLALPPLTVPLSVGLVASGGRAGHRRPVASRPGINAGVAPDSDQYLMGLHPTTRHPAHDSLKLLASGPHIYRCDASRLSATRAERGRRRRARP
jgi:hypothetical protein